ncbi:hypothetical protein Scep_023990 [Stephania cephalantha]|uniref:Isopenicillin N synthase-like Fe(2+) 2OG dioxygenase domain-containing protein n=1 Tax=Stephania cephalantha TaxID=152367 RepID=A0AAP0HY04_9MAGN
MAATLRLSTVGSPSSLLVKHVQELPINGDEPQPPQWKLKTEIEDVIDKVILPFLLVAALYSFCSFGFSQEVMNEYKLKSKSLVELILNVMAEQMALEEDYFNRTRMAFARFNCYLPCSRPDLVCGFKPHADGGTITLVLIEEEVEGLQVFKDGKWIYRSSKRFDAKRDNEQ